MPTLRNIKHLQASILIMGMLACSCGQHKARYEIDSLIEGYAYENELERNPELAQEVDLAAASETVALAEKGEDAAETDDMVEEEAMTEGEPEPRMVTKGTVRVKALGRLADVFNDSNYRQYAYAEELGISPITDLSKAYHTRRPMLKIQSNADYSVDTLTHSLPYLVPEASSLLSAIGRNFQDSLKKKGNARYRIRVTSLLRTPATVKRLRRVNVNATDSSTHQFGTTFDISYHRFHCLDSRYELSQEALKNVLAEVLYDLRKEGRCLVKFERKTGCFHVTATR
ncbi:MAG: hypothetical protein K2K81_03150 [Muribaculaceae bacterium]|nr:hypothetical protein [Muribaculaceae bacterium]